MTARSSFARLRAASSDRIGLLPILTKRCRSIDEDEQFLAVSEHADAEAGSLIVPNQIRSRPIFRDFQVCIRRTCFCARGFIARFGANMMKARVLGHKSYPELGRCLGTHRAELRYVYLKITGPALGRLAAHANIAKLPELLCKT